jgi:hypothetical protein
LSRVPNNSGQGMSKAKSSYFLDGRSSTPENTLDANKKFNSISMVNNQRKLIIIFQFMKKNPQLIVD